MSLKGEDILNRREMLDYLSRVLPEGFFLLNRERILYDLVEEKIKEWKEATYHDPRI